MSRGKSLKEALRDLQKGIFPSAWAQWPRNGAGPVTWHSSKLILTPRQPGSLNLYSARREYGATPRGMVSTLHPETHGDFCYSQKRQAYGSVSPALETPKVKSQGVRECQQEARARWFKAYAESRSEDARPSTSNTEIHTQWV